MLIKGTLEFSGILKLTIDCETNGLDLPTQGLTKNQKMHVTLVHQQIFKLIEYNGKQFRKFLSKNKPEPIEVTIDIDLQSASIYTQDDKKVLVFFVTEENQTELDFLVQDFFASYNLQDQFNSIRSQTPDEGRRFHISYANSTGNPGDSIAVVW